MKKKVRIYKAPDGKGKYVNKTSKFIAKAQMGGTPDPSMFAYPSAQPAQEQDNTNQLIQFVVNDITNQVAKEKTLFQLVNIMGVPIDAASELYVTIAEKLTEDIEKEDDRTYEQETGQPRQKEAPLTKDAIITENPEQDIDYDLFDDTGSDIVMEDSDQGPDILDEALDPLAEQRYGGITRSRYQDGGEYDVALPSAENYEALVQPMMGYDLVSQMAWNSDEESNSPYAEKEFANTTVDYSRLQNGGAYKKAKKKYVSSVMGLLKKQMGGTNESDVDPNQGDPTGANFREGRLKLFTDTVKNDAQMFAMQNQIEQQYDQMMQEGGVPMPEQDVENPMHHLQLYSQATSGIFGEPMNQTVKAQKGMIVGDDLPRGFYKRSMKRFGNIPNLREVDVRKSGLFGPKQYTMYFNPSPLQQLSNPMSAEMYGYGSSSTASRKQTRTFDAVKTYTNLATDAVNKESLKEVDKNTPGNEATTVKEEVGSGPTTPGATQVPVATNPVVTAPVIPPVVPPVVPPVTPPANQYQLPTPSNEMDWAPGVTKIQQGIANYVKPPTMAELTKRAAANPSWIQNLQLPGDNNLYWKDFADVWHIDDQGTDHPEVTNKEVLKKLNAGKGKGADYYTLKENPGYLYRHRADGVFVKLKQNKDGTVSNKPIAYIKPGDKNYEYIRRQHIVNLQVGGFVTDPFNNPMEPLQRFVGGGYDPSINDLSENQIQYMDSKDVTDAYMQGGGFIKNFIPANLTRSSQNDVVQRVYNPVTGETRQGGPGAGNYLSAIDVRKSGITGTPKKYTIYYGSEGDPRYENLISLDGAKGKDTKSIQRSQRQQALENAGYGDRTDVTGLKGKSKRAIRQGERERDRELKKLYEEDPTNVEFTKIDQNAPYEYEAQIKALKDQLNMDYVPSAPNYDDVVGAENEVVLDQQTPMNTVGQPGMPQDMVVGPSDIPVNINTPAPIAKPATGKQTEEFCFGNSCFEVPDQQKTEYDLFYETPELFSDYGRKNNSPWFNKETGEVDLSQVDAETARKIIKEGIPKNVVLKNKSFDNANVDAYSDAWLKYSQGNQEVYGDKSWNSLHASPSIEGSSLAEKYADFLNVTGQTAEGKPYSIWDTTGPLQQTAEQAAARSIEAPYMKRMTSEFGPSSMEGPMATAEDQVPTLEEQYMEGFQPTITRDMIDQASGLRLPPEPIDMGAWSGTTYPADILQPGVNPFELPVGGGEYYYPPFAQPTAPVPGRNNQPTNRPAPSGPSLDQLRAQQRRNPNAGKDYTFKPNMAGMEKDPDYVRAMQNARKDGVVTNQEAENASRIFKQKQAEKEKAKVADQAQRTINQIMNSSASTAEKNKAREKVVLQMEQRWDEIDRAANSRKYGGALSKFVGGGDNQPFTGESPIAYTNNPMMQGKSDLDLISLNSGIQGAQGQVDWGAMSSQGIVNQKNDDGSVSYGVDATYKGPQAPEIKIDPMQQEEFQVAKTYSEPLAIDVKNKLSQGEREARLIAGNSLMRGVAGFKNRIDDTKQMEGFYDNLTADNLYASDPSRDRGDYAESGLYRPDEQGQTWYGRSAQMGGYIDDDFEDGEEVYMTDEEIKEYMANGGQIEFI